MLLQVLDPAIVFLNIEGGQKMIIIITALITTLLNCSFFMFGYVFTKKKTDNIQPKKSSDEELAQIKKEVDQQERMRQSFNKLMNYNEEIAAKGYRNE